MAKFHGKKGKIILEGVGEMKTHGWSLSSSRDVIDVSEQYDDWKDSLRGQGLWSGAFSAYYDGENVGKFYDMVNSQASKDIYLYPQFDDMTKYFYGDVFVDADIDTPVDGAIDISGTLAGKGQLLESGF